MSVISFVALLVFLPLLLLAVYQTATIISRATGTQANIMVDVSVQTRQKVDPTFMHAFAQGGEETDNWLTPILKEVTALKPARIRIDHIYDYYNIVNKKDNTLSFDFSRLDLIIDAISQTGATPVISLSYMPAAIAKDGKIINPPTNWDDWALVVQKTIEHVSGQSQKNLSGVYYEVWNEPDHEQFGGWSLSGDKNYLTLYQNAAKGASAATQTRPFFFGGPATTGLYKNWIVKLVESGARLDFLSWHSYLDDPMRFREDQNNLISWLIRYPEAVLLPKLITEFGFTGAKDIRYGNQFAAAYTAAVFRQLATAGPQGLFTFQIKDGPNQEKGDGWGLITHQSQGKTLKPRYYVFSFLDRMAGTQLSVTGEGTWVSALATQQGETMRILLVNYDATGNHTETVPVRITNLNNGTYTYAQQYLQGLLPDEAKTTTEIISDGTLSKQLFMPAQSVVLLEISKK